MTTAATTNKTQADHLTGASWMTRIEAGRYMMITRFTSWISKFYQPHPDVQAPAVRRQVSLFLAANCILLSIATLGTFLAYLGSRSSGSLTPILIMGSVTAGLAAAQILARTPRFLWGIILTLSILCLGPYGQIFLDAAAQQAGNMEKISFLSAMAWLGPAMILAGIFLPLRHLAIVAVANVVMISGTTLWLTGGDLRRSLISIGLVTALGSLVMLERLHSRQLERLRRSELEAARDQLEIRVMERTAHLAQANSELLVARQAAEEAFHHRSSYLAEVSHDLRTPLTIILGFSEMLNYQAQARGEDETSRYLTYIETSARYLVDLSKNLIDLARLERGDTLIECIPVWLPDLLEEVLLLARPLVSQKNNRLSADLAPDLGEISSDPTGLRQILINLLSNAGKFTEAGEVVLHARRGCDDDGQERVVFSVSDTGIGMTATQVKALFQPYPPSYRSTRDHYSGSGLGLAIAHLLCTRLGGSIEAHSQPNRGSTFTVRLPVRPKPAE